MDKDGEAPTTQAVREPPLLGAGSRSGVDGYKRSVRLISLSFLGVFFGFQAAQLLQTSLNSTLGFINLAALYGTFTLVCLVAPRALAVLEAGPGLNITMMVCALTYAAMAMSNVYTKHWALPIAMNVLVGVAAPLLWVCQNDYVGRCAYHAVRCDPQVEAENREESLRTRTAEFNSVFFSIYQFAGMAGSAFASSLMLALAGKDFVKDVLFVVLGTVTLLGGLVFLSLARVPPGGDEAANPSMRAVAALPLGDVRMGLMVPLIFTNGMTLAFILGDFPADVICPVAGPSFTGFVGATFYGVNSLAVACWGKLISSGTISRRTAYIASTACEVAFLLVKFFWQRPSNYEKHGGEWDKVNEPAWFEILSAFLLVSVFAIGDAFWESGPAATLQNFFLGTPNIVPAMSNYKMWQSLGFAVQFVLGAELSEHAKVRDGYVLALCLVSLFAVLILDRLRPIR